MGKSLHRTAAGYNCPTMQRLEADIVIVGGGHAGAEAAWFAAGLGVRTVLVSMSAAAVGRMSCNPAIGGLAKGQIVREIDALGGLMGLAADATGIQFRLLNRSKGPAVRGPRAQADKYRYEREVQRLLATRDDLRFVQGIVEQIHQEDGRITGVSLTPVAPNPPDSQSPMAALTVNTPVCRIDAPAVIVTSGTFMKGLMHIGETQLSGGRYGEPSSEQLSESLASLGLSVGRLKTGTCPRLDRRSIDFDRLVEQPGDAIPEPFSDLSPAAMPEGRFPVLAQVSCYTTQVPTEALALIRANLDRAPLFNGQIAKQSVGPRYCPSIEDKVVRFADKSTHHVFLEPEGLQTDEVYCNGISTSLPRDIQEQVVRLMPGCETASILRYGYAVEYDMVWPHQIDVTGMVKQVPGLFLAGQINGTSGYEEAAGQGLVAAVNAVRWLNGQSPWRLRRDQAYLGVMMDDLVTKAPTEPYRMFTSRAEHRLLLRSDNAPERLTAMGRELGTVDDRRWAHYQARQAALAGLSQFAETQPKDGRRVIDWLKRPEVDAGDLAGLLSDRDVDLPALCHDRRVIEAFLSTVKYAGFIDRHLKQIDRLGKLEDHRVPMEMDYGQVVGLRIEAQQTLARFRPATLGQAGRLAGITPADLTVLAVALGRGG